MLTLNDVKQMDKPFITPAIAAQIVGCDPQYIRVAAREAPETLGFPVMLIRSRVKIPRLPFIGFVEGNKQTKEEPHVPD